MRSPISSTATTRHWFGSRWLATTLRVAPFVTATALVVAGVTLAVRTLPSV